MASKTSDMAGLQRELERKTAAVASAQQEVERHAAAIRDLSEKLRRAMDAPRADKAKASLGRRGLGEQLTRRHMLSPLPGPHSCF